jgi:NADH:ubiquinone oxidoreductase subunit 5 (subunit L)/multisubunit Na+/H+ antiporter MnhA subunit
LIVSALSAVAGFSIIAVWLATPSEALILTDIELPQWLPGHLKILLRVDQLGAIFSTLTTFFQLIIVRFSRVYLHREDGFHRFFVLIFLLSGGMQLLSLADNLESFFIGWEFIGLASFFLIGFYRHQERSANNALKVFSVYRIGDFGLILTIVIFHLLYGMHSDSRLSQISSHIALPAGYGPLVYLSLLGLIVASAAKSAQFPFTFWLPKAMEGPTPSSAIFYGALSVHAGVLLLLRLAPIWSSQPVMPFFIGSVGFLTIFFGIGSGRVQTSIKGQLAYASAVQVGFIFIEIALGWTTFAMFHIASHALYRSLQLIVSPSIITHIMALRANDRDTRRINGFKTLERWLPTRIRETLYVVAIQENYLEHLLNRLLIAPLQALRAQSRLMAWSVTGTSLLVATVGYLVGLPWVTVYGLLMCSVNLSVQALIEEDHASRAVNRIIFSQLFIGLSCVTIADWSIILETIKVLVAMLPFAVCIKWILRDKNQFNLRDYSGLFRLSPSTGWMMFLATAALIGIPPLPGFFFEDLMIANLLHVATPAALLAGSAMTISGIAGFRLCSRVTMGKPLYRLQTQNIQALGVNASQSIPQTFTTSNRAMQT